MVFEQLRHIDLRPGTGGPPVPCLVVAEHVISGFRKNLNDVRVPSGVFPKTVQEENS